MGTRHAAACEINTIPAGRLLAGESYSRPKDRLFSRRPAGWYLIDFARSRHTNPARTPVVVTADWYQSFDGLV
jgi:hypothetical protein